MICVTKTMCELCTSQCSQECYFHNGFHWSQAGRYRCSCWHSRCSWLRSYMGCSHTRWCLPRTSFPWSPAGRCTGSHSPRLCRDLRYCRDLEGRDLTLAQWLCFVTFAGFLLVYSVCSHTLRTGKLTGLAVINVGFTVASGEARFAATLVTAQSVLAGCTIATWILHTLFDVHLTGLA